MESKKAQIGIEFIIIMSGVMLFMSIFFIIVQNNTQERTYQKENTMIKEIAITVQNEINLAASSIDGYSRDFKIPYKAGNLDYEVNVSDGIVFIKSINDRHSMALPVPDIVGQINITQNTIKKTNGVIYLNQ